MWGGSPWPGTSPPVPESRSPRRRAYRLSGIQLGGRAVIHFIGFAGLEAAPRAESGRPHPSEPGVSLRGRREGAGRGINEMPLGANTSLIGVTYGALAAARSSPHTRAPRLVGISN